MKLARYRSAAAAERLGVVTFVDGLETLVDVRKVASTRRGAATPRTMMELIEGGTAAMDATEDLLVWAAQRQDPIWLDDPRSVQWLTPVPEKSIFCAGRNYGRHMLESQSNSASPSKLHSEFPTGFIKLGRTLVPNNSQVQRPADVLNFDYEVEIALVMGKAIDAQSDIDPASAIFGYTIFNDLSAREWQLREMQNGLIMLGKNFPGFGPIGPYILTADEVPDPTALVLWLKVNGELRQHADCRDLIFSFPELVAFWSRFGLVPGDVISTGTPEGVALHHKPDPQAWYLKPGDRVEAGVHGIGVLETFIV